MSRYMSDKATQERTDTIFERYENLDPITFQVLRSAFESICREMGYTMCRTAYSPIFVDGQDFSCAILDHRSELIATANYDPSHLSAMAYASEWSLIEIGYENLYPGDVIMHNDPYQGGGHLTDFTVIKPVFYKDELFALAVSRAHHLDVGGKSVGGFPGDVTEIYAEGFRLPPVKWYEKGRERFDVFNILLTNVRIPTIQYGDFNAQLASLNVAADRLIEYVDKYGLQTVRDAMSASKDYSESKLRQQIKQIPDGTYEFQDFMDDDGATDRPYKIKVAVTIECTDVMIDYTGSSQQASGPINSVYANTASSTFNVILHTLGQDVPFNHGCFRPIKFIAPRGTVVNPNPPAPVFGGVTDTTIRIIDVIMGALAQAIPDKVIAATYGTCNNLTGGGKDPETGQDYVFYFFTEGGWGAAPYRDGWNCTPNQTSNFRDYPVEIIESQFPLLIEGVELNVDSAGPGKFRGGFGTIRKMKTLSEETIINALGERHLIRPWGLFGGYPAKKTNALWVRKKGESEFKTIQETYGTVSPSKFASLTLKRGDAFAIVTTGGGGYYDPLERDTTLVVQDVDEGLISLASAKNDYGVVIERKASGQLKVDVAETLKTRQELAGRQPEHVVYKIVSVDQAFIACRDKLAEEGITEDPYAPKINAVANQISDYKRFCQSECMKQADGKRCPFYNSESLAFWSFENLVSWTRRQCPLSSKLNI